MSVIVPGMNMNHERIPFRPRNVSKNGFNQQGSLKDKIIVRTRSIQKKYWFSENPQVWVGLVPFFRREITPEQQGKYNCRVFAKVVDPKSLSLQREMLDNPSEFKNLLNFWLSLFLLYPFWNRENTPLFHLLPHRVESEWFPMVLRTKQWFSLQTGPRELAFQMAKQNHGKLDWTAQQGPSLERWHTVLRPELPWPCHSGISEELPDSPREWP